MRKFDTKQGKPGKQRGLDPRCNCAETQPQSFARESSTMSGSADCDRATSASQGLILAVRSFRMSVESDAMLNCEPEFLSTASMSSTGNGE